MRDDTKLEDEIFRLLTGRGRGRIFFAQEFYDLAPESSVRFALSNLSRDGKIARVARGVFVFPELTEYGMKMILPDAEQIAQFAQIFHRKPGKAALRFTEMLYADAQLFRQFLLR